jgi:phage gpG-like protein
MSNPHPFNRLKADWRRLFKELPIIISNLAMNEFKANFRRQGLRTDGQSVERWEKRKGKKSTRPLLTKSGRLKRSFKIRPTFGVARVVNNAPYAKAHNEGYKGAVRVRKHRRGVFAKAQEGTGIYSIKTRKEKMRGVKRATGQTRIVKAHSRQMDLPKRPFMKTTPALQKDMEKKLDQQLKRIFK